MLACLGHHAVVGRDDDERERDAGRARHHRTHQTLVPGNVHESDGGGAEARVGEA